MKRTTLATQLGGRFAVLCVALAASGALAQPTGMQSGGETGSMASPAAALPPVAPGTTAGDIAAAPGLPGPQSVDPAPGASGPYANHSENAFYNVDDRIARYEQRASALSGSDKRGALKGLSSIKAEEKEQIARHGSLLDWARENLNHRLDQLKQTYPALAG